MIEVLLSNLLPLYIIMGLGYLSAKFLDVKLHSLAVIAIFILTPVVLFGSVVNLEFKSSYFFLPLIVYAICVGISFVSYKVSFHVYKNNYANLIAMAAGTGNTGYFGLPLVLALTSDETASLYIFMLFGLIMYEITYGYYIGARGNFTLKQSLIKVIKLPAVHAVWLAIGFNYFNLPLPQSFFTYWDYFTGAWIIVGMMLVGVALHQSNGLIFNPKLLSLLFCARFAIWPLVTLGLIFIDISIFQYFNKEIYLLFFILGTVPLAANPVAFAEHLNLPATEMASAVFLTTLFALVFMPVSILFFGKWIF
jgi:predicted permease